MIATAIRPSSTKPPVETVDRIRRVHSQQISFIPNSTFRMAKDAGASDRRDWDACPRLEAAENNAATQLEPNVAGLPAHFMRLCETPIMTAQEERSFFRRMNYLKFRSNQLQKKLGPKTATSRQLDEIDDLVARMERIRNHIIQANVRLVMSIAKKFTGPTDKFDDSFSEGITSLINAVEKFDFDRGFRFSTYATTSIQRDLYRLVMKSKQTRTRFSTGADEMLASCSASASEKNEIEVSEVENYNSLTEMIDQLDSRERLIIRTRFGFDTEGGRKQTYTSLAKELGVSKERVRQLANRAVDKLRNMAPEFGLA